MNLPPFSRRYFLRTASCGFGYLSLASLLQSTARAGGYVSPLAPKPRYRSLGNGAPAKPTGDRPVRYKLGLPVDASGETADGKPFQNIEEFRQLLLKDRAQLARNLTERLIVYATGAGVSFADRAEVERILSSTASKNHGLRSLVHAVVQSPPFRSK